MANRGFVAIDGPLTSTVIYYNVRTLLNDTDCYLRFNSKVNEFTHFGVSILLRFSNFYHFNFTVVK
jgi:hypothetical protein